MRGEDSQVDCGLFAVGSLLLCEREREPTIERGSPPVWGHDDDYENSRLWSAQRGGELKLTQTIPHTHTQAHTPGKRLARLMRNSLQNLTRLCQENGGDNNIYQIYNDADDENGDYKSEPPPRRPVDFELSIPGHLTGSERGSRHVNPTNCRIK